MERIYDSDETAAGDARVVAMASPDRPSPTVAELQESVRRFRDERDWRQFHTLKDLAAALAVEASELQQELLWVRVEDETARLKERRSQIEEELADVIILSLTFADTAEIDVAAAVESKLELNAQRYPAERARGKATRHTEL
jgi:dCTP diphosphatase